MCLGYCHWVSGQQGRLVGPVQCVVASRPILSSYCLLRPWYVCLSAVAYGDSSTTSQAEVPLERIHVFYWEMGPFTDSNEICRFIFQNLWISESKSVDFIRIHSHLSELNRDTSHRITKDHFPRKVTPNICITCRSPEVPRLELLVQFTFGAVLEMSWCPVRAWSTGQVSFSVQNRKIEVCPGVAILGTP